MRATDPKQSRVARATHVFSATIRAPVLSVFSHSIRVCIYDSIYSMFAKRKINKSKLNNVPDVQQTEEPLSQYSSLLEICFLVSMTTHVSLTVARLSHICRRTDSRQQHDIVTTKNRTTKMVLVQFLSHDSTSVPRC